MSETFSDHPALTSRPNRDSMMTVHINESPMPTQTRALPPVTLSVSLLWLGLVTLLLAYDSVAAFGTETTTPIVATE